MTYHAVLLLATTLATTGAALDAQAPSPAAPPPAAQAERGVEQPADYVIGPDDVLGIVFWREPDISGDVTVRPDGKVSIPVIGEIQAAGLLPSALREQIAKAATKYLAEPNVAVVVRAINSRKVFVTGLVTNPGAYPLSGPMTVMQAIAVAGGLQEYADAGKLMILRDEGGRPVTLKFNYRDVSKGRNLEQNIRLKPGDTIVVP